MSLLSIRNLRKSYGSVDVLHGINLDIPENAFVVFVGPSGCGKSTLLRSIAGLSEIDGGTVYMGAKNLTDAAPVDRNFAMVFQSYALYPQMTVSENIGFALSVAKVPKPEIERKVNAVANQLRLSEYLNRLPKDLSGGQRQRVAIGRAILRNPAVFLFDEPLSNLDAELRVEMRMQIAELRRQLSATFIYVTHDQVEAMTLADTIVVLRDGRIEQIGAPMELYHRPANTFVAGFLGSPRISLLSSKLMLGVDQSVSTLGLRPEHLRIVENGRLVGPVRQIENLGSQSFVYVDIDGQLVVMAAPPDHGVLMGETLSLDWRDEDAHHFNDAGERI